MSPSNSTADTEVVRAPVEISKRAPSSQVQDLLLCAGKIEPDVGVMVKPVTQIGGPGVECADVDQQVGGGVRAGSGSHEVLPPRGAVALAQVAGFALEPANGSVRREQCRQVHAVRMIISRRTSSTALPRR